jgi:RNA polymerase sigma-70 factor (ECF subfamily)
VLEVLVMSPHALVDTLSDEDLVRRCRSGEEDAFAQLYHRYRKPVLWTAYRIIRNMEDAREATQEIFLKVYRSLAEWNPDKSKLSTWLYRLAANHAIDRWRAHQRRLQWEFPGPTETRDHRRYFADPRAEPLDVLERKETACEIRRCTRRLPRLQQRLFVLRHYYGFGLAEIASIEGRSLGTVKGLLFRAATTMRRRLTRRVQQRDSGGLASFIQE